MIRFLALLIVVSSLCASPSAASERRLTVAPGVELRVLDVSPAEGATPVVLLPGWGMGADVWSDQAARLAVTRRVVSVDPRGQGVSTKAMNGLTPEQRARDLQAVLEASNLKRVHLVGWSMGAQDVAAYVEAFGVEHLASVVFVDAAISKGAAGVVGDPKGAAQTLRLMSAYTANPEGYADGMVSAIVTRPGLGARKAAMKADILRMPTAGGSSALVSALLGRDRTPALDKVSVPALVIAAATASDLEAQRQMAARLVKGRFEVVEGAGHAVFIDQPDRFAERLAAFLAEVDRAG